MVLEAQKLGEGPQGAGIQTAEEGIEGWQNMPPQNMPLCLKDYVEPKKLKKIADAKIIF